MQKYFLTFDRTVFVSKLDLTIYLFSVQYFYVIFFRFVLIKFLIALSIPKQKKWDIQHFRQQIDFFCTPNVQKN